MRGRHLSSHSVLKTRTSLPPSLSCFFCNAHRTPCDLSEQKELVSCLLQLLDRINEYPNCHTHIVLHPGSLAGCKGILYADLPRLTYNVITKSVGDDEYSLRRLQSAATLCYLAWSHRHDHQGQECCVLDLPESTHFTHEAA